MQDSTAVVPSEPVHSLRCVRRTRALVIAVVGALVLAAPALAGPEEDLAQRYAPVVRLVEQLEECGPGEPYEPSDIDAYLEGI